MLWVSFNVISNSWVWQVNTSCIRKTSSGLLYWTKPLLISHITPIMFIKVATPTYRKWLFLLASGYYTLLYFPPHLPPAGAASSSITFACAAVMSAQPVALHSEDVWGQTFDFVGGALPALFLASRVGVSQHLSCSSCPNPSSPRGGRLLSGVSQIITS